MVTVPGNCTVGGNAINEHWTFYAILQPDSDSMQVWHTQIPDDPVGEIGCMVRPSGGWGNRRLSGNTDTVKTEESSTQAMLGNAEPFMMPSDSGATKEFTDGDAVGLESGVAQHHGAGRPRQVVSDNERGDHGLGAASRRPPAMRARSTAVQFATTISSPALSGSRKMKCLPSGITS